MVISSMGSRGFKARGVGSDSSATRRRAARLSTRAQAGRSSARSRTGGSSARTRTGGPSVQRPTGRSTERKRAGRPLVRDKKGRGGKDRKTPGQKSSGKTPTRERLVEAARELFLAKGYEATGTAEILREAKVNSGSLYYFFKSKEALLLAVLERYTELLHPVVMEPVFTRVADPIDRVFGVMDGYRHMLLETGCRQGCPIGNLALEMSEKSEAVRELIAKNFDGWRAAIRRCLIDAGDRLPADVNRDELATFVLTLMEGSVMQARAYRSIDPFDASVSVLRAYFDRLLVDGRTGR